jgi:hypothetical protein
MCLAPEPRAEEVSHEAPFYTARRAARRSAGRRALRPALPECAREPAVAEQSLLRSRPLRPIDLHEERAVTTRASPARPTKRDVPASVEAFLAALEHPFKQEILALRQIILGADPSIAEGIKWNAPSFRTTEYFATFQLRAKGGVQIILHLGAKARDSSLPGLVIADPESLLEWLAKDRASVKFRDQRDIDARRSAFRDVIRRWIGHVGG